MRKPPPNTFSKDLEALVEKEIAAAASDVGRTTAMVGPLSAAWARAMSAAADAIAAAAAKPMTESPPQSAPSPRPGKLAYSVNEFATITSIGRSTVWKMIKSGEIEIVRLGTRTLIPSRQFERLMTARSRPK